MSDSTGPINNAPTVIPTEVAEGQSTKEGVAEAGANAMRKFKVKIDGQEQEVSEQDLLTGYQTRQASDKAFREAAQMRKQSEEFVRLLKTDPLKVLNDPRIGHDVRKLAEEYLVAQMEEEMLDPREKELRDTKNKLKAFEDEKNKIKAEEEATQQQELRQRYAQDYQKQIISALSTSGLPKSEHTIKRMAYYLHEGVKRGMSLEATDVVDLVKQDYINEQKSLYGSLDGDDLIALLGDEIATKIRKHDIAKLKSGGTSFNKPSNNTSKPNTSSTKKTLSRDDWKARMERIKQGKE